MNDNRYNHDSEPADPPTKTADHEARRQTRLSPATNPDIPKFLIECGDRCGSCPDFCDPLCEKDIEGLANFYAANYCDSPRSMTVERAREAYIRYERASQKDSNRTATHERVRHKTYPKILNADRYFRAQYNDLTTVMLTRRVSPLDANDEWLYPIQLDMMINNKLLLKKVRKAANYQLRDFDFNYVRVTATTESAATPHEHRYFWIDDPENEISVEHFTSALQKHIDMWANARQEDHPYDLNGDEGAITVRHDPPLVDQEPDKVQEVRIGSNRLDGIECSLKNTQGAQYLASQLPHMAMWNKFDSDEDPKDTLLEGAAIAKATQSKWFGASNGVPRLES